AAEKKLDEAIAAATDPGEKEQLEQLRWGIHVIKVEREKARKSLEEAKKKVKGGDVEAARKAVEEADPPDGTPQREEIETARAGEGELAAALEKPKRDLAQGPWKPTTARAELPAAGEEPEELGLPDPIPPSEEPGDDGAPIGGGELVLAPKPPSARRN